MSEVIHVTVKDVKKARKKALRRLGMTLDEYREYVDGLCCVSCGIDYDHWSAEQVGAYRALENHEFLLGESRVDRRKAREALS